MTIFNTADGEKVVSASRLRDLNEDDSDIEGENIENDFPKEISSESAKSENVADKAPLNNQVDGAEEDDEENSS